jgi:hypothetical protein
MPLADKGPRPTQPGPAGVRQIERPLRWRQKRKPTATGNYDPAQVNIFFIRSPYLSLLPLGYGYGLLLFSNKGTKKHKDVPLSYLGKKRPKTLFSRKNCQGVIAQSQLLPKLTPKAVSRIVENSLFGGNLAASKKRKRTRDWL